METIRRITPQRGQRTGSSLTAKDILQWVATGKKPQTKPAPQIPKQKPPTWI